MIGRERGSVVRWQNDARFGGAYDPLTEEVTLRVAASRLVNDDRVRALPPFTMEESRANIARTFIRANGAPPLLTEPQ